MPHDLPTDEYHWRAHYLGRSTRTPGGDRIAEGDRGRLFEQALCEYRWTWIVPRELDEKINPVFQEFPDFPCRVLAPPEHDALARMMKGCRGDELAALVGSYQERWEVADDWKAKGEQACKVELAKVADYLDAGKVDDLHKRIVSFIEGRTRRRTSDQENNHKDALGREWPRYPGGRIQWLCAVQDDLGEASLVDRGWLENPRTGDDLERPPLILHKDATGEDPQITADMTWFYNRYHSGWPLVIVHPWMDKKEIESIVRKARKIAQRCPEYIKRSSGVVENGEAKLQALRWFTSRGDIDNNETNTDVVDLVIEDCKNREGRSFLPKLGDTLQITLRPPKTD